MLKHKLYCSLTVLVLLGTLLAVGMAPAVAQQRTFVTIATGGLAGVYYPLGGGMARLITNEVDFLDASVQSTGASVANVGLLDRGNVEFALIQNDIGYYASTGTEMFEGRAMPNLKGVAMLYPETIQIVTLAGSGIHSVADLAGRSVAVGAAGSGTEANARQILAAYGLTYDDISPDYLSFAEAASNLRDRNVDAAFLTAGFPTAAVTDLATSLDIRVLDVSEEAFAALSEDYPFYTRVTIPQDTYRNMDADVQTVAVMAMLATNADVDADIVYESTKAIFDNLSSLADLHSAGARISLERAQDGQPLELHEGAARYFGQ